MNDLKGLHNTQRSIEKLRIQMGNRSAALIRGVDDATSPIPAFYVRLVDTLEAQEKELEALMQNSLLDYPVWEEWLCHVRGIGPGLGSQLLAMLLPPLPNAGPGTWYKAAGLYPQQQEDGEWRLPRARKGQEGLPYYPWLRRCLYNVATSFVRQGNYYRRYYEKEKERLQNLHGETPAWPAFRIDRVARWRSVKLFLSHLWEAWCVAEHIPLREPLPWVLEYGGHRTIIPRPLPNGDGYKL